MKTLSFHMPKINLGVMYIIISALFLSLMSAFVKVLTNDMPTVEIVFFRNLVGVVIIGATLIKAPVMQKGGKPLLLVFRATIGLLAMLCFFYNIANIPLADAVTYSRTSPIFTAIFAMLFLKEKIGWQGWIGIFLGFLGMLMIMQPQAGIGFTKYHIFGLFNAVFAALAFTSLRELRHYYDTRVIVLVFMSIGLIVPLVSMMASEYVSIGWLSFMMGVFVMPQGVDWFYLLCIGFFAMLGQIYMTKAYGETKAGIVGAAGYSIILFSLIIGLLMGDSMPNLLAFGGIFCIVFSGLMVARRS